MNSAVQVIHNLTLDDAERQRELNEKKFSAALEMLAQDTQRSPHVVLVQIKYDTYFGFTTFDLLPHVRLA